MICHVKKVPSITTAEKNKQTNNECLGLSGLHIKLPFGNATPASLDLWVRVQGNKQKRKKSRKSS